MFKVCIGLHRQTFIKIYVTNTHVYFISLYLMNGWSREEELVMSQNNLMNY